MITSSFKKDIEFIYDKLKNKDHFSFSKYADGEFKILVNENIKNVDGWVFDKEKNNKEYNLLLKSYQYIHKDYYVGISCPCCQPKYHVDWMRNNVGTTNLTWANLFVNSNYSFFLDNFLKEFDKWESNVNLIANKKVLNKKLPFDVDNIIPIDIGWWKYPYVEQVLEQSKNMANHQDNQLFLFSAGPLGNILAHQLHVVNPNNTYLDIGSTINPWIVGNNRGYLRGNNNKTCTW